MALRAPEYEPASSLAEFFVLLLILMSLMDAQFVFLKSKSPMRLRLPALPLHGVHHLFAPSGSTEPESPRRSGLNASFVKMVANSFSFGDCDQEFCAATLGVLYEIMRELHDRAESLQRFETTLMNVSARLGDTFYLTSEWKTNIRLITGEVILNQSMSHTCRFTWMLRIRKNQKDLQFICCNVSHQKSLMSAIKHACSSVCDEYCKLIHNSVSDDDSSHSTLNDFVYEVANRFHPSNSTRVVNAHTIQHVAILRHFALENPKFPTSVLEKWMKIVAYRPHWHRHCPPPLSRVVLFVASGLLSVASVIGVVVESLLLLFGVGLSSRRRRSVWGRCLGRFPQGCLVVAIVGRRRPCRLHPTVVMPVVESDKPVESSSPRVCVGGAVDAVVAAVLRSGSFTHSRSDDGDYDKGRPPQQQNNSRWQGDNDGKMTTTARRRRPQRPQNDHDDLKTQRQIQDNHNDIKTTATARQGDFSSDDSDDSDNDNATWFKHLGQSVRVWSSLSLFPVLRLDFQTLHTPLREFLVITLWGSTGPNTEARDGDAATDLLCPVSAASTATNNGSREEKRKHGTNCQKCDDFWSMVEEWFATHLTSEQSWDSPGWKMYIKETVDNDHMRFWPAKPVIYVQNVAIRPIALFCPPFCLGPLCVVRLAWQAAVPNAEVPASASTQGTTTSNVLHHDLISWTHCNVAAHCSLTITCLKARFPAAKGVPMFHYPPLRNQSASGHSLGRSPFLDRAFLVSSTLSTSELGLSESSVEGIEGNILLEARNLWNLTIVQTLLLGDQNTPLHVPGHQMVHWSCFAHCSPLMVPAPVQLYFSSTEPGAPFLHPGTTLPNDGSDTL
ncbi:hypothetical protein EDB84DRAFT_1436604 [Lactarius hengduanensis]|nr:hypothetical protein EDB84DRAFT_1436604 [Lactarius hengduanensis]